MSEIEHIKSRLVEYLYGFLELSGNGKVADGSVLQAWINMQAAQYSSGSNMHVEERSASVMIQTFASASPNG